jgi:glycosyltransferase involved in cell wall biosynthesis
MNEPTKVRPEVDEIARGRRMRIGILIVAYNAVTTLVKVLDRIPSEVWDNVAEVVVFDDASQDSTYESALEYKAEAGQSKLRVIKHAKNLGYGGNQKAGYQYFMQRGFDVVVLLHGDGQYAPEVLSHLYQPLVSGETDAVFGSRMLNAYGGPLKGGMPFYKYIGNRILTIFENFSLGMNLTEFHSGYRAYSLHALRQIDFSRMTDDFHFDTEIIIKLNHQGFRIHEVPIPTYYGDEICYVNGLKYAKDVAKAVYRYLRTRQSVECFPEFQEYFTHYPPKTSKYSSHYWFLELTGHDHEILDCGCGEAFFAAELAKRGNRITGLDVLPMPKNAGALEQYFRADLGRGLSDVFDQIKERRFDRVLLMDVLEHLARPELLLQDCHQVLKGNGQLLVSVPNVANITVRLLLLFGRFDYTTRGILDRTHVRFFTRKSARQMLVRTGYRILHEKSTVIPLELAFAASPDNPVMVTLNRLLAFLTTLMPTLFGYQHIFVVAPERSSAE